MQNDIKDLMYKQHEPLQERFNNQTPVYKEILHKLELLEKRLNISISDDNSQNSNQSSNNEERNLSVFNTGPKLYHTCLQLLNDGFNQSGLYNITPISGYYKIVYCDQTFSGGGWIVIMRNKYGKITFDQTWAHYKNGFGDLNYDFWLGNEYLYRATTLYKAVNKKEMELSVSLEDTSNNGFYARYKVFLITSESDKYRLSVSDYSGTAGDSLSSHHALPFTTKDRDNDFNINSNCANSPLEGRGGWWYLDCFRACLTKTFHSNVTYYLPAPKWFGVHKSLTNLKSATMQLREKS